MGGLFPVIWESVILLTDKSYKDYIMLVQGMGVKVQSEEGGPPALRGRGGGGFPNLFFVKSCLGYLYIKISYDKQP